MQNASIGTAYVLAAALFGATALQAQVVAVPEAGTADAGIGSQPIANVASNDTINGTQAVLGTNATVSKTPGTTLPPGISFNTSTGAVKTSPSLGVGSYSLFYQLCDLSSPPICNATTDTVNVINASISPMPDSGSADAGTASKVLSNVTVNDSINGATVVLGTNATVSKTSAAWPPGLVFTPATGAVTTTAALTAQVYTVQYQLCDKNVPMQCVPTTITVNVSVPNIVATPETGNAKAGISAIPIANVTTNDSINGASVVLGSGGNGTVAQAKNTSWQSGVVLNPASGAITTTIAVPPGVFSLPYQLCDLNSPPTCSIATDTVTVAATITALPQSGVTTAGIGGTVIPNVAAGDSVNNAPASLVPPVNATVAQYGTWPPGITLNPTTGAISVDPTVAPGTYQLQYQLCDLYSNCAVGSLTVAVSAAYSEQLANSTPMGDVEFDWGRDGISCPTCNFGDGNSRANWTSRVTGSPLSNLWIAHLNVNTGTFDTSGANDELVDTWSTFWNVYGNGPEWTFSTAADGVTRVSQLVYSRVTPTAPNPIPVNGMGQPNAYVGAAYATQTAYSNYGLNGQVGWTPAFFPGAIGKGTPSSGNNNSNLPEGSQCVSDASPLAMYKNFANPLQLFTEALSSSAIQQVTPFTSNGIGERFVPCTPTRQVLYQANAPYTAPNGTVTQVQQVFWYDVDRQIGEQLTTDSTSKSAGFMFQAPDFGDNYIFFTLGKTATGTAIQVYEQIGTGMSGQPLFTLVNSIPSPDPNELYMNSAEPFINCTPTCTTYVFTTLAKTSDSQNGVSEPNGLAVVALNPATPMFNILIAANSLPARQRLDPEYFITPQGPYLYYNRIVPQTGSTTYKNTGEWFIDMQLGAPAGNCVGSSAQSGLMPGC